MRFDLTCVSRDARVIYRSYSIVVTETLTSRPRTWRRCRACRTVVDPSELNGVWLTCHVCHPPASGAKSHADRGPPLRMTPPSEENVAVHAADTGTPVR